MDDQQLWQGGLQLLSRLLNDIPADRKQLLTELLADYSREKESLAAIALAVDSETTCRECAGQCCLNGKYRMNVLDALSHCAAGITVLPDFLQKPLCPYGTTRGCTLEPGLRPAGCVFFICDALDRHLSDSARTDLTACEQAIRACLQQADQLLGVPVNTPLLLWAENNTPV